MSERDNDSRPNPARVVADADVLATDLLVGGPARNAMDVVRSHSWIELVASDRLLSETVAVITKLAAADLADWWRERVESERISVEHPAGDHPALGSAYAGNAAHVVSFDETLASAKTNLSLQQSLRVSIRSPAAFVNVFDPDALHEAVLGTPYEGPDRDPRQ